MNILKLFSYLAFTLLIVACNEAKRPTESNVFKVLFLPNNGAFFRGHDMSDKAEEILKSEVGQALINTDSLLTYRLSFPFKLDTIDAHLYYTFDSFGLFEIQADLYVSNPDWMKPFLAQIDSGLTQAYGLSKTVGSIKTWTTVSPSNNIIEITLGSELDENDITFLSLNLLEPLDYAL